MACVESDPILKAWQLKAHEDTHTNMLRPILAIIALFAVARADDEVSDL